MFEIAVVSRDEGEVPLTSRRCDPGVGGRDRTSSGAALGHNVRPDGTSTFVGKQGGTEINMPVELFAPRGTPLVEPRP